MKDSNNAKRRKRVGIYTRVSTDDQKENGFSLPDQYEKLVDYCNKKGYEIVAHYQDDHSAKTFNRPAFQQFLSDVKEKKIAVDGFICVRPDRFSRNLENTLQMLSEFKRLGIEFETIENHTDLSSPENYLPFIIHNVLPQIENERRSLNTKQGMRQAMKEGRFVGIAPFGYKNNKLTKLIEIDEKTAPYVVKSFEDAAKGIYSVEEIRRRRKSEGGTISKQTMLNILRNPTYCGKIKILAWKDEEGRTVDGLHKSLISEELFYEVQNVLDGRKKKIPTSNAPDENLPLRGHLECPKCGGKLTGSGSVGRNKNKKHYYYHCQHGCKERVSAKEANEEFEKYLASFQIPKNVLTLYNAVLEDVFNKSDIEQKQAIAKLDNDIAVVQKKKISLEDKYLNDTIEALDYRKIKQRIDEEENTLVWKRTELNMEKSTLKAYFDYSVPFLYNIREYYSNAELNVKQKIVGSIFPEKLIFSSKKYRTPRTNELVALITNNINSLGELRNKKADISVGLSKKAPPLRRKRYNPSCQRVWRSLFFNFLTGLNRGIF